MTRIAIDIPRIQTERLILREPRAEDFEIYAAFMTGPRATFLGGPQSRFDAFRGFASFIGHWHFKGFGQWMLTLKGDETTPLGRVGFMFGEGWDEPELGWALFDGHEGQGYMTEAAIAARDYGARHFDLDTPISYIHPDNARSLALASRLGAGFEREGEIAGMACHVYRHAKMGAPV